MGLSINESVVLDVLIKLTLATTVASISRRARLPRTTVSDVLRKLRMRKLAERVEVQGSWARWKYSRNLLKRPFSL